MGILPDCQPVSGRLRGLESINQRRVFCSEGNFSSSSSVGPSTVLDGLPDAPVDRVPDREHDPERAQCLLVRADAEGVAEAIHPAPSAIVVRGSVGTGIRAREGKVEGKGMIPRTRLD